MSTSFDWCVDAYNYWPTPSGPFHNASLILLVLGGASFLSFIVLLYFLRYQNSRARKDGFSEGRTSTLIFPLYTKILWLCAFAVLVDAVSNLVVPTSIEGTNTMLNSFLYGGVWAIYHFVFEGVALLMLNDGVGRVAARKSGLLAGVWSIFTWAAQGWITYSDGSTLAIVLAVIWSACLVVFYGALWLLPISLLFRRPCVIPYARFWCLMRLYLAISNILRHYKVNFGYCMYLLGSAGFQSPLVAWVVYACLLRDCQYWLGILNFGASTWNPEWNIASVISPSPPSSTNPSMDTLRRPLLGTSLAPHSARVLAAKMDSNRSHSSNSAESRDSLRRKGVKVLNFAFLRIDEPVPNGPSVGLQQVVLGSGSSSRVFQGTFRDRPVAIKMIFCPDLTPETVVNFYHEATLLAQLQHTNVVEVFGVCVLPPSICLVMELCEGGNLYDFLRTPTNRQPLTLWRQLSLAWDCCSAVQFLHTHQPAVLHLDLKSLNFLLTRDGRVKVADLELSREIVLSSNDGGGVVSGSELTGFQVPETLYWLAPEIIEGRPYSEKADVYALALVIWEIFTASVPYRSLEDSLIHAAKNAKYLELCGYSPGSYPSPPESLPYSLAHGINPVGPSHIRRTNSIGGSLFDEALLSGTPSSSISRRDSSATSASAGLQHERHRTDSSASLDSAVSGGVSASGRETPTSTTGIVAPRARVPGRRSISNSSQHRYGEGGEEESEMSTPSSAGSNRSGAPSPSMIRIDLTKNGTFFAPSASASPPLMSDQLPTSGNVFAPVPSPSSGVSLLTHENLASFTQQHGDQPIRPWTSRDLFAPPRQPHPPQSSQEETDPVLIEWKRMHRHMHDHPILTGQVAPALFPTSLITANQSAAISPMLRPSTYTKQPRLPPIPQSIGSSYLSESIRDPSSPASSMRQSTVSHLAQTLMPINSMGEPSDGDTLPQSDSIVGPESHLDHVRVAGNGNIQGIHGIAPVRIHSVPFQSDLSPISSLAKHSSNAPTSNDSLLPPPPPPSSSSSSSIFSNGDSHHPVAIRHYSAPDQVSHPLPTEGYVQYESHSEDADSFRRHSLSHSTDGSILPSPHDQDDDEGSTPLDASVDYYPSTVPTRSILSFSHLRPTSPDGSIGSVGSSQRLVGPTDSNSQLVSPALSAMSEGSARIPRIKRLTLDDGKKKSSSGSSSKKKRTGTSTGNDRRSKSRTRPKPKVDYSSIYVARSEVQTQLQYLICVAHYRPTIPADMPDELAFLLTRAWHPIPHMRPTATEFVQTIANILDQLKQQTRHNQTTHTYTQQENQATTTTTEEAKEDQV